MQKLKQTAQQILKVWGSRAFAVTALAIASMLCVLRVSAMTNTVVIRDEGVTTLQYTFEKDANVILKRTGIITGSADDVDFSGIDGNYAELEIMRAFPVSLTADGETQTLMTLGGTVADVFEELDVAYDSNDIVQPELGKTLEEGEEISIQRVEYVTTVVEEVIPYSTITKPTPLLHNGKSKLLQEGQEGIKVLTYVERTVDGITEEAELEGEHYAKQPLAHEVLVGESSSIVSPLDFSVALDETGAPMEYTEVLTDQIATGYYAGRGAWGASGMQLSAGYVAVNPNIIPFGTQLYIASEDGSFVYGYAIAADTGTGLMADTINVDLYYDTYAESCLNGRKIVNIYILD